VQLNKGQVMQKNIRTRYSLLEQIRDQHDDNSWEEFMAYYSPYIRSVLYSLRIDNCDIDDLQQEVCLKIWRKLPDFKYEKQKGGLRAWFCTVTRNAVIDFIKSHQARRRRDQEFAESLGRLDELEQIISLEWKKHISHMAWEKVCETMTGNAVECFKRYAEGEEVDSIAESLQIRSNSVYVYCKRVREQLRKEIANMEHNLG
jgi:RNA polymerase sigma factor (sigma-70 family)